MRRSAPPARPRRAAAPALGRADPQFTLLVMLGAPSKYHYEYIPVARESLERLGRLHAFAIDWRKDGAALEGDLGRYAAILLLNTPADEFTPAQRAGFERYMGQGGNAMVVHRAAIVPAGACPGTKSWSGAASSIIR